MFAPSKYEQIRAKLKSRHDPWNPTFVLTLVALHVMLSYFRGADGSSMDSKSVWSMESKSVWSMERENRAEERRIPGTEKKSMDMVYLVSWSTCSANKSRHHIGTVAMCRVA